jgi:NADH dehydrogenase
MVGMGVTRSETETLIDPVDRRAAPTPYDSAVEPRPRVVIIGGGFAGLTAAKALGKTPVDVTVIDRRNHHLFQPLLYQVATAALSPADIATPIRSILRRQSNTTVVLGRVTGIDTGARLVTIEARRIPYDMLIVATGARHAYFGHDEWERVAPGLKTVEDATAIRRRILLAFERAETEPNETERRRLLNFVVIGAGPTGVELAGSIAELGKVALAADFRNINPQAAQIMLVEAGPRILAGFPPSLSAIAHRSLERLGVEIRLDHAVTACDEDGIVLGDERIEARTVVWAAGVAASPAADWLGAEKDRAGRVLVRADLTLPGHDEIFVLGDTARIADHAGGPLPGTAPVAKQQGAYAAKVIKARVNGMASPPAFKYRNLGNLATIGRKSAVADFGWIRLSGRLAWLLWGIVHISFLIGFRNRFVVLLDWIWAYITFQRGARLITGPSP